MHGALWHREGPKSTPWPLAKEPVKATPLGDADQEPLGIFLGRTATEKIEEALTSSPDAPVTGLLVGLALSSPRRPFILVTHALPVDIPVNDDGEPEFSADAFADAYGAFAELGGGLSVVGWFSARPRQAPEMSAYERYSHRKHFPEKWQVAFLIDSIRGTSRLYRWDDERLVACNHFYFWDSAAEPVEGLLAQEEPEPAPIPTLIVYDESIYDEAAVARESEKSRRIPLVVWLSAAALLLLIYLLIPQAPGSIFWLRARQADQAGGLSRLERDLAALESEGQRLQALLGQSPASPGSQGSAGTGQSAAPAAAVPQAAPASPGLQGTQAAQVPGPVQATSAQSATAAGSQAAQAPSSPSPQATGSQAAQQGSVQAAPQSGGQAASSAGRDGEADYVIQPGDTMWSISLTLLGDPWQFRALAEANDIEDPSLIFPGQRLRLPRNTATEPER